jgi:hypothetical protein
MTSAARPRFLPAAIQLTASSTLWVPEMQANFRSPLFAWWKFSS